MATRLIRHDFKPLAPAGIDTYNVDEGAETIINIISVRKTGGNGQLPRVEKPAAPVLGRCMVDVHWLVPPGGFVEYELTWDTRHLPTSTPDRGDLALLFKDDDFKGPFITLTGTHDFRNQPLNDNVSSIVVVHGDWVVYKHSSFVGPYTTPEDDLIVLRRGWYPDIDANLSMPNDDLSSIRPVADLPASGAVKTYNGA